MPEGAGRKGRRARACYRRRVAVVGLGVDVVEPERVARALARWGERQLGKRMDPEEAALLPAAPEARAAALARAIAAKEAASKALGTGWSRGVRWRDVAVRLEGEPSVTFRGRAAAVAARLGSAGRHRLRLLARDGLIVAELRLLA
jgi:holo-[acyl-carrier protein] synthase